MSEKFDFLRAQHSRRRFLKGLLIAGATSAVAGSAGPTFWPQSSRFVPGGFTSSHVGFGSDPRSQATISFAAAAEFRHAVIEYGQDDSYGAAVSADVRGVAGVATKYGHARLSGLAPGGRYLYRVRLDGVVATSGALETAPHHPAPFTFTAFGDEGVSRQAAMIVNELLKRRPKFHLLAGDICYADSSGSGQRHDRFDPRVWDAWLYQIRPVAASVPWMCATGNHDMEPGYGPLGYDGYLNRFAVPENGAPGCPSTYSFSYGNVAFISLDSNDVSYEIPHNLGYSRGEQTAWLNSRLASYRADPAIDFIVVFFHHCAFGTSQLHGSEGGVREHWVPSFDAHEVDLVINGHAHLYERTSPIRHGLVVASGDGHGPVDSSLGTTYITAGGGGRPQDGAFDRTGTRVALRGGRHEHEPAPWALPTRTVRHSFLSVDVRPAVAPDAVATMSIATYDEHGRRLDGVVLRRGRRPDIPTR